MLLRSKLLLSFVVMLLITCIVAYSGWTGIAEMTRLNHIITSFGDGTTELQEARYEQLRFVLYGNPEYVDKFKVDIAKAKKILNNSLLEMHDTERIASTRKLITELDVFEQHFFQYVQINLDFQDIDAKIKENGVKVGESIRILSKSLSDALDHGLNSSAGDAHIVATELNDLLHKMRFQVLTYDLTGKKDSSDNAFALMKELDTVYTELYKLLTNAVNREQAENFAKNLDEYEKDFAILVDITNKRAESLALIRAHIVPTLELSNSLGASVNGDVTIVKQNVDTQVIVVVILSLLIGIALAIFLTRNINAQLGRDPSLLQKMAEKVCNNDYNIDDGGPKKGVYASLLEMVVSLQHNIELAQNESKKATEEAHKASEAIKVAEAAKIEAEHAKQKGMLEAADQLESIVAVLSSASTQLAAQVEQSDRGAVLAANRLGETATAMEEMNSTVMEVARNASVASQVSANTRQKADDGAKVVRDAVQSIEQVQKDSMRLKEDMQALSQQAQAINQIMGVISDIADQTNLLALNAAIEAARAGDAGRGFAVVADEVRKLAEKTMSSTSDVGNAITSIQHSASKSMAQVDATVQNIEKATKLSILSGEALHEIVGLADSSADQVRVIATASEEQSATSEEINRSLAEVNAVASESASSMREAGVAVNELVQQAHQLSKLITQMKNG